ncbi:hypothetical protein HN371_10765 [Candidatus Poribacteria bacterium]|jgi:hypothetical protein|nr:hypothetical protein [Candidatus Poribacteria bacterium]MBT5535306.1 hypothetical protein [Candidatus Poribacteria bacterium]MBT5711084.1 hypothetical protein [Candidatus Poribacteria bacterium]MBT7099546.1 hypothetical protein [Candidatus Poribacteria bacterium]MBT7807801.1 hypothetical protein [Candidatus Poribacteria bacterium]
MRRRLLLVALWLTVAAVVALFDWGVTREPRTTYTADLGAQRTAPYDGG